jgi:hypothetical protein
LEHPDGVVRDVVFPVVGEKTLRDLVEEWKATGPTYRITLRTVIRNSYRGHYRRMVPTLLASLEFRSNNDRHRPLMDALNLVKRFAGTKVHTFPADEDVPLNGVVRGLWREAMIEKDAAGRDRINRVTYEIAVLDRCASGCDARKSGLSARTATVTLTTIYRSTSSRTARTTTGR